MQPFGSSYAKTKYIDSAQLGTVRKPTKFQLNPSSCLGGIVLTRFGDKIFLIKGGGTKNQTKRVAQNTHSIKFSALQTPGKIQNLFLKRALIP